MPKTSVHLGLTLELPNQKFGSIRADVTYSDIDTEGDLEAQVAACRAVALAGAEDAEGALAQLITDASGFDFEGLGVTKQFNEFKAKIGAWAGKTNTRLDRLEPPSGPLSDTTLPNIPTDNPPVKVTSKVKSSKSEAVQ